MRVCRERDKGADEDCILRNILKEKILQKRLRLSGQRSRGNLTVKYFGSQGKKRAFYMDRMVISVQYCKEFRKS